MPKKANPKTLRNIENGHHQQASFFRGIFRSEGVGGGVPFEFYKLVKT